MNLRMRVATSHAAALLLVASVALPATSAIADHQERIEHVLLISVDGLHQSDLEWYVANHPDSELAKLTRRGAEFSNAHTSDPSDSDPGGTALMTGGDVVYDSPDDIDFTRLDAGEHIPGIDQNPALIMNMTGNPQSLLVPATFPVDPTTCRPIPPHAYLKVNTIYEVIKSAGLRTAWSDKHPVYESFNGPSGHGIDDLFAPEIDSNAVEPNGKAYPDASDWAHDDAATKQYDGYKVQAIINEINGFDHSGRTKVGTPAIFGMNFQTVSVAQKLDSPGTLTGPDANGNFTSGPVEMGGYFPGTKTPRPLLQGALDYVNDQLQRMVHAIHARGLKNSTAIIITAKHGQSPQDPNLVRRIKDSPIIAAINSAWAASHPSNSKLIVAGTDDDLWQSYLSDKSQTAADFVKNWLWTHDAPAKTVNGSTVMVAHSGLLQIFAGEEAADFFGVPNSDPRHPDVFGRVQLGVIYTGSAKLAEHGGDHHADQNVPILVYAPGTVDSGASTESVKTTQVAPTILQLLGLDPRALRAVQIEGTRVLPGLR